MKKGEVNLTTMRLLLIMGRARGGPQRPHPETMTLLSKTLIPLTSLSMFRDPFHPPREAPIPVGVGVVVCSR
jgi:hypothetical protein